MKHIPRERLTTYITEVAGTAMVMPSGTNWLAERKGPGLATTLELKPVADRLVVESFITVILHRSSDCQKTKNGNQDAGHFTRQQTTRSVS